MRIKRLTCFDIPKINKNIELDGIKDTARFQHELNNEALIALNFLVPLKYKFLPESYILLEQDEILGLITVVPTRGNPYKINITKLIFRQNFYDAGKQLVEFVIARYGAKGAVSFCANVDQAHKELLNLFLNGCGFRQCSYENTWDLSNFKPEQSQKAPFRYCQNSDAAEVANLYNSELNSLYKPSMERIKQEYREPFFAGLVNFYKNRYVLEDALTHKLIAYLSITTADHKNFIIDISTNDGYKISYDKIINFALGEISRRKTNFNAYLKHRQYTRTADNLEKYLHERNLNCIRTKCVLVKDLYRPVKVQENVLQVFFLGETAK